MIIPGLKGSGLFLGDGDRYIERLFGDEAPFHNGIIYLFLIVMMICGFIYGYLSKNIKDSNDYSLGLSTTNNTNDVFWYWLPASGEEHDHNP